MITKELVLEKTRDLLKDNLIQLRSPKDQVRVMQDEKVPPAAGEEFIGVYGGEVVNILPPSELTKRITHGLTIGITRRVGGIPNEQAGEVVYTYDSAKLVRAKPDMLKRAEEIVRLIDSSWDLMTSINDGLVAAGYCGCFYTTFGFISLDAQPQEVNEDHFDMESSDRAGSGDIRYIGLLLELQFGGAEYFRTVGPPA